MAERREVIADLAGSTGDLNGAIPDSWSGFRALHQAAVADGVAGTAGRDVFGDIPEVCVMDAGNNGFIIPADKMLPPRKHGVLIPGPRSHAMKIAFEKYFMWKARHGYVNLP